MERSNIEKQKPEIFIFPDRAALMRFAAWRFVTAARQAIAASGRFAVALSGGSTPRDLYTLLATPEFATQVDWARVHIFWGDERAVPPDHLNSNFRMVRAALLWKIPLPPGNIHRVHTGLAPEDAARTYESELRKFFTPTPVHSNEQGREEIGKFDLILLGLGSNGHTASLFPHTKILHETQRWVAAEYIDEVKMWRITLTVPTINAAKNIVWLVAGADKADTVREVLHGAYRPDDLPAQLIQPQDGRAVWLLDDQAGALIKDKK